MQIDHAGNVTTVYGHLSAFAPGIEAGTRVSQGDLVGFVGDTGRSTGARLHFEIVATGRTVNPLTFPAIKRSQLTGADLDRFKNRSSAPSTNATARPGSMRSFWGCSTRTGLQATRRRTSRS